MPNLSISRFPLDDKDGSWGGHDDEKRPVVEAVLHLRGTDQRGEGLASPGGHGDSAPLRVGVRFPGIYGLSLVGVIAASPFKPLGNDQSGPCQRGREANRVRSRSRDSRGSAAHGGAEDSAAAWW